MSQRPVSERRLPNRARRLRRRFVSGLTLIEILVVLAIVAVLTVGVMGGSGQLEGARLKQAATLVSGAVRAGYGRANATSKSVRLVFDFEKDSMWLEEADQRHLVQSNDKPGAAGANPVTDAERAAAAESERIVKGPKPPRATFKPVTKGEIGGQAEMKALRALPRGITFLEVSASATHNIDANLIEAAITPKTKAIMLAHSLGNPFNLDVVTALCKKYGLWLVEDGCDALGATYKGQMVGTFGDIGTLSFYPAHHITMGEGGAVFTNNAELKLIAESFRDWGRDCYCPPRKDNTCNKRFCWKLGNLPEGYDHKYTYSHLGYNLKISDMQAACALAQLERLDDFIAARKANFAYLKTRLKSCEDFLHLPEATPHAG